MPDRKKVGDVDPAGKKAFKAELDKAKQPMKPAKPMAPVQAQRPKRRVRDILDELKDALDPDTDREVTHIVDGKKRTVMDVVDEAVTGTKEKPDPEY